MTSWQKYKDAADKSFYFFCKSILGYKELRPQPHAAICKFVDQFPFGTNHPANFRLLEVPRDCFKTTIGSVGYTLRLLTKFPDISILLSSSVHDKTKAILSEIKQHATRNDDFIKIYGRLQSDILWDAENIIISTRTKPNKTPSVSTTGIGGSKTMHHYYCIIVDDAHDEHNYKTPDGRKKVIDHISALLPLKRPNAFVLFIGTPWHPDDAHSWIKKSFKPLQIFSRGWKNNGKLLFPGKLTETFIETQKNILAAAGNIKLFYGWYECNPRSDETVNIRYDWRITEPFVYIPSANWDYGTIYSNPGSNDEIKRQIRICGVIDPADSEAKTADFTGVTIKGIDSDGKWWVIIGKKLKDKPMMTIKEIVEIANKYKCATWGVEVTGGRSLYRTTLQEAFLKQQMFCRVLELKSGQRAKAQRIESLVPRFEARNVVIHSSQIDLIEELDYPEVTHDDVIDSLAYHNLMDITPPPPEFIVQEETNDPYEIPPGERKNKIRGLQAGRDPITGY